MELINVKPVHFPSNQLFGYLYVDCKWIAANTHRDKINVKGYKNNEFVNQGARG